MPKTLSNAEIAAFRTRLIDVAERLFATHGPHGVTMRQLADALGVSSMTAYRYFDDKDAILAAVRTRAFNRFAEAIEDTLAATLQPMATRRGRAKTKGPDISGPTAAYLDFALANPTAYRLMFDIDQPTYTQYPILVAAMERARVTMSLGLRELAAQGSFAGDVELAAHTIWSALHGPVMLELAGLLAPPLDARTLAKYALEALIGHFQIKAPNANGARKRTKPRRR